ncbi:MAG: hypothetical protein GAK30_02153 [Paracidovorax wautersii]|uniref:Transglycosylase associated protein n=1 Tax=Paracidovorax wautersii TaxID=1177982 RepID=A0A7V8JQ22_9BURK|nr:MAG: hypothetical protein GAK30_02153 [Paracidovorax wautersii]
MGSILVTIIVGLVVGLIARAIKPGDDSLGLIWTIVLGILGALLAGWFGQWVGWYAPGQPAGWIASVVGAIVLLVIYGFVRGKRG